MDAPPSQRVRAGAAQVYKTLLNTLTSYPYCSTEEVYFSVTFCNLKDTPL